LTFRQKNIDKCLTFAIFICITTAVVKSFLVRSVPLRFDFFAYDKVENSFCAGMDNCSIHSESAKFRDIPFRIDQGASCDKHVESIQWINEIEWENCDTKWTFLLSKSLQATAKSNPKKSSSDIDKKITHDLPTHKHHELKTCEAIVAPQTPAKVEGRTLIWHEELDSGSLQAVMILDAFCMVDRGCRQTDKTDKSLH
jgi:hypothetical protein